jgi:hypothetical protein
MEKNRELGTQEDDDKQITALVILIREMVPIGKHGRASISAIRGHWDSEVK